MNMTKRVTVKNVVGSSKKWATPACLCDSWIEHWECNCEYGKPQTCPACGCEPTEVNNWVGGHVQKVKRNEDDEYILADDEKIYIVPICDKCNKDDEKVFSVNSKFLVLMEASECIMNMLIN